MARAQRLRRIKVLGGKYASVKPKTQKFWKHLSARLFRRMNDDEAMQDSDLLPNRMPFSGWQD
jgi:hypothetical protein